MEKTRQVFRKLKKQSSKRKTLPTFKLPVSLRRPDDERRYIFYKKTGLTNPLIEEPRIKEWQYWALIENAFSYSAAFKTSHMLIPKRVVAKKDLNKRELTELDSVMSELADEYDCYMVNFFKKQSIRYHYHIHFLVYHDERKSLRI